MKNKTSIETLKDNICKLKPGKGPDNIPSCLLKEVSYDFLDKLALLINLYFKHIYQLFNGTINAIIKDNK